MGVCVGASAMQKVGLAAWYENQTLVAVDDPELNHLYVGYSHLFYLPETASDDEFIQRTMQTMFCVLKIPTKERALVDYMRHLDVLEELYFAEGLHEYLELEGEAGRIRLLEVADHYGVREEMQKWIDEDKDYTNWG